MMVSPPSPSLHIRIEIRSEDVDAAQKTIAKVTVAFHEVKTAQVAIEREVPR